MSKPYIAVIGAANIDLRGRSYAPLIPRDSNPGEISSAFGGVGRNVAHNLRLLDTNVQLLTAFGDDVWASELKSDCIARGIGLDGAVTVLDMPTSSYLYITGPDGDMALAVCNTDVAGEITPQFLDARRALLENAALVVFDGNLAEETIAHLCEICRVPLFADPVSVTKAERLKPFLRHIYTLKPNAIEAAHLTGEDDPEKAANALVALGVKRAFVSAGENGIFAADQNGCKRIPCFPAEMKNATGSGDAAMAALCRAYLDGCDLEECAMYAAAAGAITVASEDTVSPALSRDAILHKIYKNGGK